MLVVNSEYIRNTVDTDISTVYSLIWYNLDEWTWEANQLIGLNRYLNSDQSPSNESFQSAIKLKHFSPSRLILTALCLQDICVSVVVGLEYGRSPILWAGRAPYFWTPWSRWIRCAASGCSRLAQLCLRCYGQVLVGNWQEWSFIRLCPSVWITSLAVWSPGLARSPNWNTEETPSMRKPRNFAKSGVYFQHSQSLSYLLL